MSAYLPQYSFEKLAAYGGMGAVFKARQESLDRPVAIKILPPEFGAQQDFAERFKSEARAMAKLNHTNIVGVYDFGITSAGHLYLVMEWVEGLTLHELIHKGSVPVRRAANLAMQLCEALAYAHGHKILHRDIKPGNILINQEDQVKVADFGLARPITGEAEENPFGTPDYAAPEILGKGAVDQRADIFAAGVVLYEMLTGRVPKNPRRSVTEYAPVSPRWDELIDQATHPDPEKRFKDVRDFRAHISMVMSQGSVAAVPVAELVEEEPVKKTGFTPLHFTMIGAGAAIVLAVVLGIVFRPAPKPEKKRAPVKAVASASEDEPKEKSKRKKDDAIAVKEPMAVEVMPAEKPIVEPKKKKPKVEPAGEKMAATTPVPVPPPQPMPPAPVDPREAIQKLEELDPELAQLVAAFGDEWSANEAIDTHGEIQELADKYIPALQQKLAGLAPEQRDHVLSEISHVANREPLNPPEESWPKALQDLRSIYDKQRAVIQSQADAAAEKMRSAQCELVAAKAAERVAAGNVEGSKRAQAVAAELAKLRVKPTLKALKQSAAVAASEGGRPGETEPGIR